jgi:predicted permease
VLVVAETSLAVVLLISAGLMARSLYRLQAVDPGFEAMGVAVARLTLPASRYDDPAEQQALWARLLERASGAPGVEAAAAASALPLTGGSGGSEVEIEGRPASASAEKPFALASTVSPDYFRVMRIPLRAGRAFGPADRADARHVVVVGRAMAERFWPGESPIGRRVRFATDPAGSWREVVGVAGDVKDTRLSEPAWPTVYVPYTQSLLPAGRLVVRTAGGGNPAELVPLLRAEVRAIDPQVPFDQTGTLEELVRRSTWTSRLYAWLAGVFAGAALLLAAVGMYGMLDYMVRQRTQEIGVRAALGAGTWSIVRLFVWRGLRLMLFSMLLGLPAGFAVSRLLSSLLYGIEASDLLVFACVPLLMLGVGLLASYLPAHTAARVDPSTALRQE